jgi:hypothetical protein
MEQKAEFSELEIKEFIKCFNKDVSYWHNYRLYGPANPMDRNEFISGNSYVCKFTPSGICHMMTCKCLEENPDNIKGNDWFTGVCCFCDSVIKKRKDAWRIPHKNGGFIGCYCSEQHMEEQFIENGDEQYLSKIKVMKAVRLKFKIQDFELDSKYDGETNNFDI